MVTETIDKKLSKLSSEIETPKSETTAIVDEINTQNENNVKNLEMHNSSKIKARNPIIVTMLIMQLVMDLLKDGADKTKELVKLNQKEWKFYSDEQSENFKKGEQCQTIAIRFKVAKVVCDLLGDKNILINSKKEIRFKLNENHLNLFEKGCHGIGSVCDLFSMTYPQSKTNEIQIEQAKFEHKVGSTSTDYQNQSQQLSSDNQLIESAREKSIQLGRLMAQILTGQHV